MDGPGAASAGGTEAAGPARPPLLSVRDLVKRFDGRVVLDGIDLDIERGETLVVIGASGSGKTTFARVLMGLERPTSGRILLEGKDLTSLHEIALTEVRRRFGMVFQRHALLDSLTVFDNVAFPLREETDLDEAAIRERVMETLRELGVDRSADALPGQLSGGMAKRVGIARAVVTSPEILVYDEPTSGLDPVTSRTVDALIERVREQRGVTSIVITHDMVTAYDVADRIVLLAGGKIAAQGDPETFFRSHNRQVEPFTESSGVDLDRLGARKHRRAPEEIRAAWEAGRHIPLPSKRRWFARRSG